MAVSNQRLSPARLARRRANVFAVAEACDGEFERKGYCTQQRAADLLGISLRAVQERTALVGRWPLHVADLPRCYRIRQAHLPPPVGEDSFSGTPPN